MIIEIDIDYFNDKEVVLVKTTTERWLILCQLENWRTWMEKNLIDTECYTEVISDDGEGEYLKYLYFEWDKQAMDDYFVNENVIEYCKKNRIALATLHNFIPQFKHIETMTDKNRKYFELLEMIEMIHYKKSDFINSIWETLTEKQKNKMASMTDEMSNYINKKYDFYETVSNED
ncbi:MAG: hypothetical protein ACK518_00780 [bacterium]|jgi:hypothetical protein